MYHHLDKQNGLKGENDKSQSPLIPEVARVRSCESINVQTEVGHSEIKHKEVTGIPHLLHCEERHDADGVEEESKHA